MIVWKAFTLGLWIINVVYELFGGSKNLLEIILSHGRLFNKIYGSKSSKAHSNAWGGFSYLLQLLLWRATPDFWIIAQSTIANLPNNNQSPDCAIGETSRNNKPVYLIIGALLSMIIGIMQN